MQRDTEKLENYTEAGEMLEHLRVISDWLRENERSEQIEAEWRFVGAFIDRVLLIALYIVFPIIFYRPI